VGLRVISPGLSATVQDLGRPGYRAWGVPLGGAFDRGALVVANALLGNPPGAAALELTVFGGTYEAESTLALALAGAPMQAAIEPPQGPARPLRVPQSFTLDAGSRLVLRGSPGGARAYLAALGGFLTRPVLGSRSSEDPIRAGDLLPALPGSCPSRRPAPGLLEGLADGPLRVLDGPDSVPGHPAWEEMLLTVGPLSDRMGLRLEGSPWPPRAVPEHADRPSAPVAPGAVQVAGGRPIILGVACGTMGGYPHVASVISADLDRLAQLRPGDPVSLRPISLPDARRLDLERRRRLRSLALRLSTVARDPA
jgi:antagonist of KipI